MNISFSNCDIHNQEIKYFSAAQASYYLPLCDKCCEQQREVNEHLQLIPLKKALLMAESNLRRQQNQIEKYLNPLKTRESMVLTIEKQKKELQDEKERLIKFIVDKIDSEIRLLEASNDTQFTRQQTNVKKSLEFKLQEIYSLGSPYFDGKISNVRKALNFEINRFLEQTLNRQAQVSSKVPLKSKKFKVFESTHHEIMISPLDLRQKAQQRSKQIKRVMNQSPLYFLIDPNLNTSPWLYSLIPQMKKLYIYSIIHDDWSSVHIPNEVFKQGAAVHDYKKNRFFWIGGISEEQIEVRGGMYGSGVSRGSRALGSNRIVRSSTILIYEPNRESNWKTIKMIFPRSSCQAVLVEEKDNPDNYGIVISGGIGQNGEVLKSTQYLDLSTETITLLGDSNFGTYSGTLVTYNKSNVVKIGGLHKNRSDVAVVETMERLDLTEWLSNPKKDKIPRWSYVELIVPQFDRTQKVSLFNANQGAIQINPNQIFVFGGVSSDLKGVSDSYILGVEQFQIESRSLSLEKREKLMRQYKFTIRWVNQKPLISGDDFGYQCGSMWKGKLHILQNMGSQELMTLQKRLLCFNMYEWSQIQDILPE